MFNLSFSSKHVKYTKEADSDLDIQGGLLPLVILQVLPQAPDLLILISYGLVEGLQLLGDPAITLLTGGELIASTLLGIQLFTTLFSKSQSEAVNQTFIKILCTD